MLDIKSHLIYISAYLISIFFAGLYVENIKFIETLKNVYEKRKYQNIGIVVLILSFLPLIIIYTFRDGVGSDYFSYKSLFNQYSTLNFEDAFKQYKEAGYVIINILAYKIFGNYQGLLFLNSILTIIPIIIALLMYDMHYFHIGLSVYLLTLFPSTFNGMRQHIAVAFVMLALVSLQRKRWKLYLACAGVALLFHKAAIISFALPAFYLIGKNNIHIKFLMVIFGLLLCPFVIGSFINSFTQFPVIGFYFKKYINTSNYYSLNHYLVHTFFELPLSIVLLIYGKNLLHKKQNYLMVLSLPYFDFTFIFLGKFVRWATRMTYYSMVAIPLSIILFIKADNINHRDKYITVIGLILTLILRFILLYVYLGQDEIYPYNFI